MYFNGPQSKNVSRNSNSNSNSNNNNNNESRRASFKEQQSIICEKVTKKLNNIQTELKDDLNKSLARLLKATTIQQTTRPAEPPSSKLLQGGRCNNHLASKKEQQLRAQSNNVAAAIQGRLNSSLRAIESGRPRLANRGLRHQRSLTGAQAADWSSLKTSLKRSLSYNPIYQEKSVTKNHFHHQQRQQQQQQQQYLAKRIEFGLANSRLNDKKGQFKNDISCQFNRCGSWLTNLHRQSSLAATLLILFHLILVASSITAAPIISQASPIEPLWLAGVGGGASIEEVGATETANEPPPGGSEALKLAQADYAGAIFHRPEGIYLPASAQQQQQQHLEEPQIDESELVPPGSVELSRLHRRRLDRDRALEPAPWMREQPMRRAGFNVAAPEAEEDEDGPVRQDEQVQQVQQVFSEDALNQESGTAEGSQDELRTDAYPVLGRQSRQLSGQVYEDILKHLFEEAVDNGELLADLYNELELRAKSNNQRAAAGSSASSLLSSQQVGGNQQQKLALNQNTDGVGQDSSQETNADSTLVVAGDEISSGGDDLGQTVATAAKSPSRPALNAAYTQDLLGSYGAVQTSDGLKVVSEGQSAANGQPEVRTDNDIASGAMRSNSSTLSSSSAFYIPSLISSMLRRPNLDSSVASVDSNNQQQQQQQPQQKQQLDQLSLPDPQRTQTVSPSFHVLEDIDQTDNAQDFALAIPTGGGQDDQQQQQQQNQFAEQTDFLQLNGASSGGAGPMKRDTAIWAQPAQVPAQLERSLQIKELPLVGSERTIKGTGAPTSATSTLIELVQSGYLSRDQLMQLAAKFKSDLELAIGLSRATIQSFYPISNEKLLIKLDTKKLSLNQMINMIQNYEFARGYIVVDWADGNEQNPLRLLTAILRMLVLEAENNNYEPSAGIFNLDPKLARNSMAMEMSPPAKLVRQTTESEAESPMLAGVLADAARNQPDFSELYQLFENGAGVGGQVTNSPNDNDNDGRYEIQRSPKETQDNRGQPSLVARLAAYLGAFYSPLTAANGGQRIAGKATTWMPNLGSGKPLSSSSSPSSSSSLPVSWSTDLIPEIGGLAMPIMARQHTQVATKNNNDNLFAGESHLMHLLILVATILGAFLSVKLILHFADGKLLKRRYESISDFGGSLQSLWPSKVASHSTTVVGQADKQKPLDEANFNRRRSSLGDTERLLEKGSIGSLRNERKRLDLLAQKLVNLLSLSSKSAACKTAAADKGELANKDVNRDEEIDELANQIVVEVVENDTIDGYSGQEDEGDQPTRFRTSRSYIRSLINALTKANNSSSEISQLKRSSASGKLGAVESQSKSDMKSSSSPALAVPDLDLDLETDEQESAEIVVSQMEISAAHLILAYMERHLEDKEQLEREWQELNAGGGSGQSSGGVGGVSLPTATSGGSRINQLVLQRLAKVALSEENRNKNRNCLAVPYDRNRVKLNCLASSAVVGGGLPASPSAATAAAAAATTTTTATTTSATTSAAATGNKERKGRVNNAGQVNDYINASYIHDDDLRRPTHIIAQGPTEQTSGQFWQMVWEQGVSVIVMLTRLNENSVKMCHCYWPTNASSSSSQTGAASSSSSSQFGCCGSPPPTSSSASSSTPADFNGAKQAAAISNGKRQSAGQPSKTTNGNGNGSGNGNGPPSPANGRRSSVTSVFSLIGDRSGANANNQPIIANGDLSNNVLYFDISHNGRDDAGKIDEESPTTAAATATTTTTKQSKTNSGPTRFEVHLVSEHISSSDYLVRNMYLINRTSGETRTITQFHYLSWPEMGVPANVKSLLQFRRKVHKSYRNLKSPILVHCSDGTGRSGTYTLIDIILERIKNGAKEIDPRATLEHLRDQRTGLCATKAQFEFVLMALAEEIQIILNALPQ